MKMNLKNINIDHLSKDDKGIFFKAIAKRIKTPFRCGGSRWVDGKIEYIFRGEWCSMDEVQAVLNPDVPIETTDEEKRVFALLRI